ncbi:MAG TPA: type III-B CRISPR module RAMP protein Cmr4 [Thermotogaceae bacterium]|nr:type III-B CRISPR module RAMP protein Cmr4 [Thermotogaceae bacterium]
MDKYLTMALDPIHIGTGGYQIGRVDNTIVREPATNIPKIPGSSIAGTARTYTTYREIEKEGSTVKISCAGQDEEVSKEGVDGHCGECIVCRSFGYSKKDDRGSCQGLVYFSDARILLFPVSTRLGPAWVTAPMILNEFGDSLGDTNTPAKDKIIVGSEFAAESSLNLGWLNLPIDTNKTCPSIGLDSLGKDKKELISGRVVVVPDNLIAQIINSNLEVRTSVSIDPRTGAGKDGALFTSEAIPRSTILWFEMNINNPNYFGYGDLTIDDVKSAIKSGFDLFETLGIGGMVTRGFGRLKIWEVIANGA